MLNLSNIIKPKKRAYQKNFGPQGNAKYCTEQYHPFSEKSGSDESNGNYTQQYKNRDNMIERNGDVFLPKGGLETKYTIAKKNMPSIYNFQTLTSYNNILNIQLGSKAKFKVYEKMTSSDSGSALSYVLIKKYNLNQYAQSIVLFEGSYKSVSQIINHEFLKYECSYEVPRNLETEADLDQWLLGYDANLGEKFE
ncbi:MAG: hypothetical protein SFT91_02785 [Rickettsiaceae bacterium]|nr:hypothetical protein [Rickettsiaceae bacterium]